VKKIKLLALDIDGVLTDGRTTLGTRRPERKRLAFQDLDAINAARRAGLSIALVTGESDGSVDVVAERTGVELVFRGAKDKLAALQSLAKKTGISFDEICYVGDGDRDASALAAVGFSLAPENATFAARSAAHRLLNRSGGDGAVNEAVRLVLLLNDNYQHEQSLRRELGKLFRKGKIPQKNLPACLAFAMEFSRAILSGRKILLCGPGAEIALEHLPIGKIAWPAVALSRNSAISSRQVKALARPGDVVIQFPSWTDASQLKRTTVKEKMNQPGISKIWPLVVSAVEQHLQNGRKTGSESK